ncbi:uncharacterized protein LOC119178393 [Rhipicephalus microplus]|uniref:uncharacterized protein LOC142802847 n=1 Tax=Rhipicephalus microplus TaxID=6941 RepID=UPI003F6C00F7
MASLPSNKHTPESLLFDMAEKGNTGANSRSANTPGITNCCMLDALKKRYKLASTFINSTVCVGQPHRSAVAHLSQPHDMKKFYYYTHGPGPLYGQPRHVRILGNCWG